MLYIKLTRELIKIFRILPAQNIQLTLKYRSIQWSTNYSGLPNTVVYRIQWYIAECISLRNTILRDTVVTKKKGSKYSLLKHLKNTLELGDYQKSIFVGHPNL